MENKDISKLIKNLRSKLGLTQEQFAQKVGVTFPSVNNWERGTRKPHPFLLKRLLEMADEVGLKNIIEVKGVRSGKVKRG